MKLIDSSPALTEFSNFFSESLGLRSKVLRKIEELRTKVKTLSSEIPDEFICPITRELMKDPVIASGMCDAILSFRVYYVLSE